METTYLVCTMKSSNIIALTRPLKSPNVSSGSVSDRCSSIDLASLPFVIENTISSNAFAYPGQHLETFSFYRSYPHSTPFIPTVPLPSPTLAPHHPLTTPTERIDSGPQRGCLVLRLLRHSASGEGFSRRVFMPVRFCATLRRPKCTYVAISKFQRKGCHVQSFPVHFKL
jgi:hypothetical protein